MRFVGFRCKYTSDSLFISGICTCIYYYFVTDINIEIRLIFSLCKINKIVKIACTCRCHEWLNPLLQPLQLGRLIIVVNFIVAVRLGFRLCQFNM